MLYYGYYYRHVIYSIYKCLTLRPFHSIFIQYAKVYLYPLCSRHQRADGSIDVHESYNTGLRTKKKQKRASSTQGDRYYSAGYAGTKPMDRGEKDVVDVVSGLRLRQSV